MHTMHAYIYVPASYFGGPYPPCPYMHTMHAYIYVPAATLADRTLPVDHMERASCEPYEWFDFYFPVDYHMLEEQDK